jgi:hypothetical protein
MCECAPTRSCLTQETSIYKVLYRLLTPYTSTSILQTSIYLNNTHGRCKRGSHGAAARGCYPPARTLYLHLRSSRSSCGTTTPHHASSTGAVSSLARPSCACATALPSGSTCSGPACAYVAKQGAWQRVGSSVANYCEAPWRPTGGFTNGHVGQTGQSRHCRAARAGAQGRAGSA